MGQPVDDLFGFVSRRSWPYRCTSRCLSYFRNLRARFASSIILSLTLHLAILGILVISQYATQRPLRPDQVSRSKEAVKQAVASMQLDPQEEKVLREALATLDDDLYEYIFEHSPQLDPRLGYREQTEIFRSLMRASLGQLKERRSGQSALDLPPWGLTLGADFQGPVKTERGDTLYPLKTSPDERPVLYRAGSATLKRLASLRSENEKPSERSRVGKVEIPTDTGFARVPGEYYYRSCPYEGMIALGASVFFTVAGFPRIETPAKSAFSKEADASGSRPNSADIPGPPDAIKIIYMPSSSMPVGPTAKESLPKLPGLSEKNIPEILDSLMGLDDGEQVRVFLERYLVGRDLNDPILAQLTRRFLYENLAGAFNLGNRISTAFDFLEELFYVKTTQSDLISYGLKNYTSRTGTEILFFLALLYDFERRALAYLTDSVYEIEEVLSGHFGGRAEVFDRRAKAFVLGEIHRDLASALGRRGLDRIDNVLQDYVDEQERIYRLLIEQGGKTGSRARYAMGGLFWDNRMEAQALKEWQAIDPSFETPTLNELRWIMHLSYAQDLTWSRINALLEGESTKNSKAALDRWTKFHHWEKRTVKLKNTNK